jgi:hypothetical protein
MGTGPAMMFHGRTVADKHIGMQGYDNDSELQEPQEDLQQTGSSPEFDP